MKATGEVMSIARTFEAALHKSLHSLEENKESLLLDSFMEMSTEDVHKALYNVDNLRVYAIAVAIYKGIALEEIHDITKIDMWFLNKIKNIVEMEKTLKSGLCDKETLFQAKKMGFTDSVIAKNVGTTKGAIKHLRKLWNIMPSFSIVDTCAAEFPAQTPYYYSDYGIANEVNPKTDKKKIMVLGSGPIRIGQGVEFDYCSVHSVWALKKAGCEAIIVNNNPETVSTDFDVSDKLYFEPLTPEYVTSIVELENPDGAIVQFGGQTAIKLTKTLNDLGVKILGTDADHVDAAEDRERFDEILEFCDIARPKGQTVFTAQEAIAAAHSLGYPVLVRPSYVLGGQGMQIAASDEDILEFMDIITRTIPDLSEHPVLVDKYLMGQEVEVDAICDGRNVFVPGIMELVERTGVHSGDSISVYPTFSISDKVKGIILQYAKKLGLGIGIVGLYNIQFIVDKDENVFIIEVNPRSSRTVPFLSKATGYSLADIATEVILGKSLKEQGIFDIYPEEKKRWYVKVPVFSFNKLRGLDAYLSPEMKSTGEAIGYDDKYYRALYKALQASGMKLQNYGTVFATISDKDKEEALPLIRRFYNLGFNIEATEGTANFLKKNGIRTHVLRKLDEDSDEIRDALSQGHIAYVINTRDVDSIGQASDGVMIRRYATENNVTIMTSLDTVSVLLDVLEETTLTISTIDS